jgi:hypothetical protein
MVIYSIGNRIWNRYVDNILRKPIQVGNPQYFNNILSDKTNDNISNKNSSYSELTALYWIWKNSKEDIIGIEHYRRVFLNSMNEKDPILKNDIIKLLQTYDCIVPNRHEIKNKLINSQIIPLMSYILPKILLIIKRIYPNYFETAKTILENNNWYIHCNMMITSKTIYDNYCDWLFTILFIFEKLLKDKHEILNYPRLFGYISEHIFIIWLTVNKINFIEKPIVMYNKNVKSIWHYE